MKYLIEKSLVLLCILAGIVSIAVGFIGGVTPAIYIGFLLKCLFSHFILIYFSYLGLALSTWLWNRFWNELESMEFMEDQVELNICECECHNSKVKVWHDTPCCHCCPVCNQRIIITKWEEHKEKCQKNKVVNK